MIPVPGFEGRQVAVFGLARSGISAARALTASGAQVLAWDDREDARRKAAEAGLHLRNLTGAAWRDIDTLVLSPGVPFTHPAPHPVVTRAREAGAEIVCDVELFLRAIGGREKRKVRIVAVTGTNGKSTVTALIQHLLARAGLNAHVGGNIGMPVLDLAEPEPGTMYVLELSSYQLELISSLEPDAAALINLSPDHLDRHGGMDGYVAAKRRIFSGLGRGARAVISVDDAHGEAVCTELSGNGLASRGVEVLPVSVGKTVGRGVYVLGGMLYDSTASQTQKVADIGPAPALQGTHNWQNAAVAYACARPFVVKADGLSAGLMSFPGLAHRMEPVRAAGKVRFINDSKATNAEAAARALASFRDIYWIAGGQAKPGGIEILTAMFPRIAKAYLIGQAADEFARTLEGRVPYARAGDLANAVTEAAHDAALSDAVAPVVLLSPACASFDQFTDFEDRGNAFKMHVRGLSGTRTENRGAA